jgi:YD repeat-containing protein
MRYIPVRLRSLVAGLPPLALAVALTLLGAQLVLADPAGRDFTVDPAVPQVGESATFAATGLQSGDQVAWDFENDGTLNDTGTSVQHAYSSSGEKTVDMQVTDASGLVTHTFKTVRVNAAPAPAFSASPSPATTGRSVAFDASGSSDPDGTIETYEWDLDGNGTFETDTGTDPTTSHAYSSAGTYTVKLRVTDDDGASATKSLRVSVTNPPTATFTPSPPVIVIVEPPSTGPRLLSPFPVVRIVGHATRAGTRVKVLSVRGPRRAKVTVRRSSRAWAGRGSRSRGSCAPARASRSW